MKLWNLWSKTNDHMNYTAWKTIILQVYMSSHWQIQLNNCLKRGKTKSKKKNQISWAPWKEFHRSEHSSSSSLLFPLTDSNPNAELEACMRSSVNWVSLSWYLFQLCGSGNIWCWLGMTQFDRRWASPRSSIPWLSVYLSEYLIKWLNLLFSVKFSE